MMIKSPNSFQVTSNVPPTPPSPSAALAMQQKSSRRSEYWPTIKKFFSNWPFIIIFLFVGGAMGYISTISTKIEQILCSSGYSDQLAGKITPPLWRDLVKWLTRKL